MEELTRRSFVAKSVTVVSGVGLLVSGLSAVHSCSSRKPGRGFSYPGGKTPPLDTKLDALAPFLLSSLKGSGRASASTGVFKLLDAAAAAANILEWFGYKGDYSKEPSFEHARECTACMRNAHKHLRGRANVHTDVIRPEGKLDDVSLMVSGNLTVQGNINIVQLTSQYGDYRAVPLKNLEPSLLAAASDLLRERYPIDDRLKPHSVSTIDNRTAAVNGLAATRLETAISTVLHLPALAEFPEYDGGILFVHRKGDEKDPNNICWAGLKA